MADNGKRPLVIGGPKGLTPEANEPTPASRQLPRLIVAKKRQPALAGQGGYPAVIPIEEGLEIPIRQSKENEGLALLRRIAWMLEATEGEVPAYTVFEFDLIAGARATASADHDVNSWAAWARITTAAQALGDNFRIAPGVFVPASGAAEVPYNKSIIIPGVDRKCSVHNASAANALHVFVVALGVGARFQLGN